MLMLDYHENLDVHSLGIQPLHVRPPDLCLPEIGNRSKISPQRFRFIEVILYMFNYPVISDIFCCHFESSNTFKRRLRKLKSRLVK